MTTCQHCGVEAPDERTYCPSCKRRLRPGARQVRARAQEVVEDPEFERKWAALYAEQAAPDPAWAATNGPRVPAAVREWLAGAAAVALVAVAVTDLWLFFADRHYAAVADAAAASPGSADLAAVGRADEAVVAATVVYFALVVLAGALFAAWLFHLARLVDQLSPDALRYHPGWAIGGWFVPILNLFRPKQMVDDVWSGSSPDLIRDGPPVYVHLWWAAFLITSAVDSLVAVSGDDTLSEIASSERVAAWADLGDLVAAGLAVVVLLTVTRRVKRAVSRARATAVIAAFAG